MNVFNSYISLNELARSGEGKYYKGTHNQGNTPVLLYFLDSSYSELQQTHMLKKEYGILKKIKSEHIFNPGSIERGTDRIALILEYFDGLLLDELLPVPGFSMETFLLFALHCAEALGDIHRAGYIHGNINPENILVNPQTAEIKIIGLGRAVSTEFEKQVFFHTDPRSKNLHYISPEQTGRMNRHLDYRSDFYSLGVVLYQLLTNELPFRSEDPMEIFFDHIATTPVAPIDLVVEIPPVINNIVLKLLEKNPDERYRSAEGLQYDLNLCYEQLRSNGKIEGFQPGLKDKSGRLQIPGKLFGRDAEIRILYEGFQRVAGGGVELMLVAGFSGVGKTALVKELYKPITRSRGFFITGKFEQYKKNKPYSAIIEALRDLINNILGEEERSVRLWKKWMLAALGDEGQLIVDVIPEMEWIIGKCKPVKPLSPVESRNRFNGVFRRFIGVFARKIHPLVLFLDDLQWADSASLEMIRNLVSDRQSGYLYLIGAYRDNEVTPSHPLMLALDDILESDRERMHSMVLTPLMFLHVNEMISQTTGRTSGESEELSSLIYSKTGGNPFFIIEFLKSLDEDQLLMYDIHQDFRVWDLDEIRERGGTDSIGELMAGAIRKLSVESQELLKLASCIGNRFDLNLLTGLWNKPGESVINNIRESVQKGLLIPCDGNSLSILESFEDRDGDGKKQNDSENWNGGMERSDTPAAEFIFLHDQVQEAAYLMNPEKRKKENHLRIGRLLYENSNEDELDEKLFDMVGQWNAGTDLIVDEEEEILLLRLNLRAGKKAKDSSAFRTSLIYLDAAAERLDDKIWKKYRDLAWNVIYEKAYSEYNCSMQEESERSIQTAIDRCVSVKERTDLYKLYLRVLFNMNRHNEGIGIAMEALKLLGVRIPEKIHIRHIYYQYSKFLMRMGSRKADDLLKLPVNHNERIHQIDAVIYDTIPSTYMIRPMTMGYLGLIMAGNSLRYGNSEYSPFAFAILSIVMSRILRHYKRGYDFGMMSIRLNEMYPNLDVKARCHFLAGNFTVHWRRPMEEHLPFVRTSLKCAREAGNNEWANYSIAFNRPQHLFFNHIPLEEMEAESIRYYEFHADTKDMEVIHNQVYFIKLINRLQGKDEDSYAGWHEYDDGEYEKRMFRSNNNLMRTYFFTLRMAMDFAMEDYDSAFECAKEGMSTVDSVVGNLVDFIFRFYYVLSVLQVYDRLSFREKLTIFLPYKKNRKLTGYAVKHCPENFGPHHDLLQAERARVNGKDFQAKRLYAKAIRNSKKSDFPHILALSYELSARYLLSRGEESRGRDHLQKSVRCYRDRGAYGKIYQLEKKYADLLNLSYDANVRSEEQRNSDDTATDRLDLKTIFRAFRTVSTESRLDQLLEKMLRQIMMNAGAIRGVLLLKKDKELLIETELNLDVEEVSLLESVPVTSREDLCDAVIHRVMRSRQPLLLRDASMEGDFVNHPHIVKNNIKSILCLPMIHRTEMKGVLYL